MTIQLYKGDCLEIMPTLPDKSVDMILTDLPFGSTRCKWDVIIPFESLWVEYKRIRKDRAATVLHATQPFGSLLISSNLSEFKYEWIWDKVTARGHLVAKKRPMAQHENILIFGNGGVTYNPQMVLRDKPVKGKEAKRTEIMGGESSGYEKIYTHAYPKTIITENNSRSSITSVHPTQKPVALLEYLIQTYTNEGDTVLDNCMGSGSTGVACQNTNRNFIGIEKDDKYFQIAKERLGV